MRGKEQCPSESSVSMNEALEGIPAEPSAGWIRSVDSQNATRRLSPPCMWLLVPRQLSILEGDRKGARTLTVMGCPAASCCLSDSEVNVLVEELLTCQVVLNSKAPVESSFPRDLCALSL